MAVEMFLKLDGCNGEAIASGHENEIELLGWNWGATNTGTAHMGSGAGAGKANFHDLTLTKYVDKASGTLISNCAKGKHFSTATLTCRKVGGDSALEYLTIELTQVFVSNVQYGGSQGDERTVENVSLNFEKVNMEYKPQSAQGSADGSVPFKWDIRKNQAA